MGKSSTLRQARGALVVLALVIMMGAMSSRPAEAIPERVLPDAGSADVFGMPVEEFVDRVTEVTTLSDDEARLIAADPELAILVPVEVETVESAIGVVPDFRLRSSGGMSAAAAWATRQKSMQKDYKNIMGDTLIWFRLTKYWEYNGSAVRNPSAVPSGDATWVGKSGGWSYNGVVSGSSVDSYRTWNGNAKGDHYSERTGQFEACLLKVGCYSSRQMWLSATTRANGVVIWGT